MIASFCSFACRRHLGGVIDGQRLQANDRLSGRHRHRAGPHTHKSYLAHLIAVFRDLEAARVSAGRLPGRHVPLDLRHREVPGIHFASGSPRRRSVALIGERAEWLAYLNCAMDRASFDHAVEQSAGPYQIRRPHHRPSDRSPSTTSTTCAACTCSTGWNRSPAPRNGTIAGRPTARWPSDWAKRRKPAMTEFTPRPRSKSCDVGLASERSRVKMSTEI